MSWKAIKAGENTHGRQHGQPDAAVQTNLTTKVMLGMARHQTTALAQSLLRLIGLDRAIPGLSTQARRRNSQKVNLLDRRAGGSLLLLINGARLARHWSERPERRGSS